MASAARRQIIGGGSAPINKKGRQKFWAVKWKFFPTKIIHSKIWSATFFPLPQTRRQVSAHAHKRLLPSDGAQSKTPGNWVVSRADRLHFFIQACFYFIGKIEDFRVNVAKYAYY